MQGREKGSACSTPLAHNLNSSSLMGCFATLTGCFASTGVTKKMICLHVRTHGLGPAEDEGGSARHLATTVYSEAGQREPT